MGSSLSWDFCLQKMKSDVSILTVDVAAANVVHMRLVEGSLVFEKLGTIGIEINLN